MMGWSYAGLDGASVREEETIPAGTKKPNPKNTTQKTQKKYNLKKKNQKFFFFQMKTCYGL